jgi:protein TonB
MGSLNVMAERRPLLRLPLPYQPPRRKRAWALSVAVHIFAVGLVLWLMQRRLVPPPQAPDHMVFIEPAPPPPPPVGEPGGAPMAPAVPVPAQPIVEPRKEVVKPYKLAAPRKMPHRPPPPTAAALPSGAAEGSAGGVVGGVVGGEAGGKVGGVVGGHGDAPFPADRVEHPPVVLTRVLPVYPIAARARNLEGRVVLRAVVDRDGHVEEAITVVKSIPLLDASAVGALRQWRFQPGRDRDGQPVRVVVDVPIRFQLR